MSGPDELAPFGLVESADDSQVVQIIMQQEGGGESLLPAGQLIQVTSGDQQMHYLQVSRGDFFDKLRYRNCFPYSILALHHQAFT